MASGLKRDLGIGATTAIAVGAMVGSGIFILPGIAFMDVGASPAAVWAFLFAGILVLPAAISAAEMATAMPEDGGPYLFVERGMGPLLGTIAGVGTWLMLSLKSALALVGGVPYLALLSGVFAGSITVLGFELDAVIVVALALALLFITINLVSAEGAGSLQFVIVAVLVAVMAVFVVTGIPEVDILGVAGADASLDPVTGGIITATAGIFVAFAGVTKVAAVAEEVKDPGRVIPAAMIGSVFIVTTMYVLTVYVAYGLIDVQTLTQEPAMILGSEYAAPGGDGGALTADGEGAIIALAAEQIPLLGSIGVYAVTAAALLALASTANAGLLAASRFPLAMARDGVFPRSLEHVSERYNTPTRAVGLTGIVIMMMVFLPIQTVARAGSAFQILVFVLLNIAVVAFREGSYDYRPEFTSPLYPWMQVFGVAGGLVVLWALGVVYAAGAGAIVLLATIWYFGYARSRMDTDSAVEAGLREDIAETAVERTRELFERNDRYNVLVALTDRTSAGARSGMLRVASDLRRLRDAAIDVVDFREAPETILGSDSSATTTRPDWLPEDPSEQPEWFPTDDQYRTSGGVITEQTDPDGAAVRYRQVDSTDTNQAIIDFANYEDTDFLLLERQSNETFRGLLGSDTDWILRNSPANVLLVEDRGFEGIDEIAVVTTRGGYDPVKLLVADAIAEETGAQINLVQVVGEAAADNKRQTIDQYHNELISILTVTARSTVLETDEPLDGIDRFTADADLLVTGIERTGASRSLFGHPGDRLVERVSCSAIMVQPADRHYDGLTRRLAERFL